MLDLNTVKQMLHARDFSVQQLEAAYRTNLEHALDNFADAREAREWIARADAHWTITRRMEYAEDGGTGKGLAPVTIWKKQCLYCKAAFETTNRRQKYCDSPGHRQQYHERKKSAQLYLYLRELLDERP